MIKNIRLSIYMCGLCAVLGLFVIDQTHAAKTQDTKPIPAANIFAVLQGFNPGALVSYSLWSEQQQIFSGTGTVDDWGNLNIALPQNTDIMPQDLSYKFAIDDDDQSVDFILDYNATSDSVSLQGESTDSFSRIVVDVKGKNVDTKSDWAGLFSETGIRLPQDTDLNAQGYQVAFYSADPLRGFHNAPNPSIIQIMDAPGGGGPTNEGVNEYESPFCGDPEMSECREDRLDTQLDNIVENFIEPLQLMTEQLTYISMNSLNQIGQFFDAKHQLETQREMQKLKAQAHKDYHPSDTMCRIGSFSKSLAVTQYTKEHNKYALNTALKGKYANRLNGSTAEGVVSDRRARLRQYREVYCDPSDNNAALGYLCEHDQDNDLENSTAGAAAPGGIGGEDPLRLNKDIDFIRTLEFPMTLDVDFTDGEGTEEEEDIMALAKNLYWIEPFFAQTEERMDGLGETYLKMRHYMALNSVAHNSFAEIVAMKGHARSPEEGSDTMPGWAHMKTLMREFGMEDERIEDMLGENPSYFAQMDVLTKKMYQSPNFYTNLYDKPVNVDRILASLEAISLMQERDHYEASLRREMLLSGLLRDAMDVKFDSIQGGIRDLRP